MLARLHALRSFLIASILFVGACVLPIAAARAGSPADNLSNNASEWRVSPSDGVEASLHDDEGSTGTCLRLDFNFTTGGGFVVIQRDLAIDLPDNYEFAFNVKGDCKPNNLEFKLLDPAKGNDPTTSSVWWVNKPAYEFSKDWTGIAYKKRHFTFAWGPNGGKPHTKLGTIEFAIASSQGGKGSVWFDGLTFRALPVVKPYTGTPTATATDSFDAEHGPEKAIDGDEKTAWYSEKPGAALTIDFGMVREFGGLVLQWTEPPGETNKKEHPWWQRNAYSIQLSLDGRTWQYPTVDKWHGSSGGKDFLYTPEVEARCIRIVGNQQLPLGSLADVRVIPLSDSATPNDFIHSCAAQIPKGLLPRWAYGEQSFWTVLGLPGDSHEVLINEEGQIEVGKQSFSIEPFVVDGLKLLTWADGTHTQSLAEGHLPIATVERTLQGRLLRIQAAVVGTRQEPALAVLYTLTNTSEARQKSRLEAVIRPFQVNPPAQFLNTVGGVANVRPLGRVAWKENALLINSEFVVVPADGPSGFSPRPDYSPVGRSILHSRGFVQSERVAFWKQQGVWNDATFGIPAELDPGKLVEWGLIVPLHDTQWLSWIPVEFDVSHIKSAIEDVRKSWKAELSHATLSLPASAKAIEDTFYAQQAYILINRDGPGFQPGSRSYERSWIRDGSMTSAAMLQLGHTEMVKEFVRWYASYQFPDGKVPCVVDARGPDPVPEHDSHGQLIMAIANVHRYTHDAAFVKDHFEHVKQAVAYIEKIRGERMTADYAAQSGSKDAKTKQEPGKKAVPLRAMYGLVPESISHEGYSAKPMHSYWDDLFVYRGLKDAAYCAGVLGDAALQKKWSALAKDFGDTLAASFALTMKTHGIDYLPGCVELGDFDATSTTVSLWPVQAQDILPAAAVSRTFDKYWEFFTNRRDNPRDQWDAYTPYELRTINAFVHLGQRDRALAALEWFMKDQYPAGWHHWAEVVWSNPRTTKFIGDMPHTWCGSDFLNSLRSMFVYEDEAKDALVLFAGVPERWAKEEGGVSFKGFRTYFGTLDAKIESVDGGVRMSFAGQMSLPKGGLIVRSVKDSPSSQVLVDGKPVAEVDGAITLHAMPTEIEWKD